MMGVNESNDTPRSDGAAEHVNNVYNEWVCAVEKPDPLVVPVAKARELERLLNAALEQSEAGWRRAAEKDAVYQKALDERDEWKALAVKFAESVRDHPCGHKPNYASGPCAACEALIEFDRLKGGA